MTLTLVIPALPALAASFDDVAGPALRHQWVGLQPLAPHAELQAFLATVPLAKVSEVGEAVCVDLDEVGVAQGRAFVDAFLDSEPNRLGEDFRNILFQCTAGHPLFTIELLRAMQERGELFRDGAGRWVAGPALDWQKLPARVEGVIEERLGQLDDHLRGIVTMACVEGEQLTVQGLARTLRIDEGRLVRDLSRRLERRHRLVRWVGGLEVGEQHLLRYRFAHALFQQHLYAGLRPGERQLWHKEIAANLEGLYQGRTESVAPQLAWHYSEAGDNRQALRYLTLAGDTALKSYASHEAGTYYGRALDLAHEGAQRAHLLEGLGRALARQSRFQEAIQTWRGAIELSRAWGDLDGIARLYARLSRAAWWSGDLPLGIQLCEEGLAATVGTPESAGRAHLLHEAARTRYFSGSPEQAAALCQQALEMAERAGAADVEADALATLGGLPGRPPEYAVAVLTRAVELAEGANLPGIAYRAYNNLAQMKAAIEGPPAACEHLQRAVQLSRQTGGVSQEILALGNLLEAWLALGELDQAQASLSRMQQLARELDDPRPSHERIRRREAMVLLHQDDWLRAASLLRLCQADARQQDDRQALFNADWLLARTLLEAHILLSCPALCDWDEVEQVLSEALDIAQVLGDDYASISCRSHLAMVYANQGRLEQAGNALLEARAMAQDWPFPPVQAALLWGEARLAMSEERWAEALIAFESLAEIYARCGMRWDRARTLIDWAAAHVSRGETGDLATARALLQQSMALFQEMGIPRYAELVEERLSTLPKQA